MKKQTPVVRIRWSVPLTNPIVGGGDCILPTVTSSGPDHLYIADGWGSTFASMKLRRLSLTTGETLATAPVKNTVRAIHYRPDSPSIYVAGDKKIFVLDAATLEILEKHDKKLLNYPAHLSSIDEQTLLTADLRQGWLFTYDLATRTGKRRRIAKSCWLLQPIEQGKGEALRSHYFADGQSGTLLHYDPATGKQRTLWKTVPYGSCLISDDQALFVTLLATHTPDPSCPRFIRASVTPRVQIHRLSDGELLHAFDTQRPFVSLALSPDNQQLALWDRDCFSLCDLATAKQQLIFTASEEQTLLFVSPARRLFFTTDTTEKPHLRCHEY